MADLKGLEKKIKELEERMNRLEADGDWMEALYKQAKVLVIKHRKATTLFLQRKLIIDYARAKSLLDRMQREGIVGSEMGITPRKIL